MRYYECNDICNGRYVGFWLISEYIESCFGIGYIDNNRVLFNVINYRKGYYRSICEVEI